MCDTHLSRGQVGPAEMHEDENLLLVADDAGLAHGEDVGRHGGNGEAERDVPLEAVLDHQLGLNLELHELDDVLEGVGGTVEEAAEAADGVGPVGRGRHLNHTPFVIIIIIIIIIVHTGNCLINLSPHYKLKRFT